MVFRSCVLLYVRRTPKKERPNEFSYAFSWSMPGRIVQHWYRKLFPNSQYARSDETNQSTFNSLTLLYVLCATTMAGFTHVAYRSSKEEKRQEGESRASYTIRNFHAGTIDRNNSENYRAAHITIGGRDQFFKKEDITEEVVRCHNQEHHPERLKKDYNPYDDEAWVRQRLKVKPNDRNFDMQFASMYLKRLDKRTALHSSPGLLSDIKVVQEPRELSRD